jgi:uncharacterized damage-inducible protein DinB
VGDRETFAAEFDHEMAATRLVLERLPDEAFAWTPHERSFSLGALATHLARLPHWGQQILEADSYDLAGATGRPPANATRTEVLEMFDAHVREVRRSLAVHTDAALNATWTLKRGGHTVLSMPRLAALRRFLMHHVIHHRGQMTVYLRLQGVPVPPLYGPSADESM